MNEFVSWYRHLLVSFLFHALTSLHPPSFHRNDFSTCVYRMVQVSSLKKTTLAYKKTMHNRTNRQNGHILRRLAVDFDEMYTCIMKFCSSPVAMLSSL